MNSRSHNPKTSALRALSGNEFLSFGNDELVYTKPVMHEGREAVGLFSASGGVIAILDSLLVAEATAVQNDLAVSRVH